MVKSKWLSVSAMSALCLGTVWVTSVPAQGPTVAMVCAGPMNTLRTNGGKTIKTQFKWAKEPVSKENPKGGECAWFDRTPQPDEIKQSPDNALNGNLGPFESLPVGTFGVFCVTKANDSLVVKSIVRGVGHQTAPFVLPPFSSGGCPA
jgi:hypothetical protein